MAFVTADRVVDTSTSTGTGAFTVSGTAPTGMRTFSAVMSVGDTCYYCIQNPTVGEWEIGVGTYSSANTLTRTTVISSSNAGSTVTFSAGTKDVFITLAASKSPQVNPSGSITAAGASYTRTTITATGGQTSFTANYTVNYVQVYVNGILLNDTDYTATSGTAIVLAVAATAGDIVDVVALNIGPFSGGVTITGTPSSGQLAAWTGSSSIQGIAAPTSAGNTIFTTDGTNWSSTAKIVQGTSVASTSGTSITFTGIPSWAKRITLMLNGVSISGNTTQIQIQLGTSGGFVTSGYVSNGAYVQASSTVSGVSLFSTGFYVGQLSAVTDTFGAALTISSFGSNTWACAGTATRTGAFPAALFLASNPIALGGTLTQIRLTTVNGTDTFDAGSVNILYE